MSKGHGQFTENEMQLVLKYLKRYPVALIKIIANLNCNEIPFFSKIGKDQKV